MKSILGIVIFFHIHISYAYNINMRLFNNHRRYSHSTAAIFREVSTSASSLSLTRLYNGDGGSEKPLRDGLGTARGYSDKNSRYILEKHQLSGLPDMKKHFLVLGIESSCDDTGAAVVRSDGKILSNVVYSQYAIHEKFGGIVPSLAMEAHKVNIEKVVKEAIEQAGLKGVEEVDAVAVTKGPGLEICLRVGYKKAQVCIWI